MKKIIHLFRNSQFTEGFINGINKNDVNHSHFFLVYGTGFDLYSYNYVREKNVRYVVELSYELRKPCFVEYIDSFDKIIYHGVFDKDVLQFFNQNQELLKKTFLMFWGGDIPLYGTDEENRNKENVISNSCGIITIINSDYEKILGIYRPKGQHFCVHYLDEKKISLMKNICSLKSIKNKESINILIGNSATETNEHIKVLNVLKKFKNEKIKIFIPLAYGEKEYANKVSEYARGEFGDKIICLTDMMSIEEYTHFLSNIDIGFFIMNRQQALGNIFTLLANGSKVFLKKGGQLDDYISNTVNAKIYYFDEVSNMPFQQLSNMPIDIGIENAKRVYEIIDTNVNLKKWDTIFSL